MWNVKISICQARNNNLFKLIQIKIKLCEKTTVQMFEIFPKSFISFSELQNVSGLKENVSWTVGS